MAKIVTKQVLLRVTEEEVAAWGVLAAETGLSINLLARKVMANACGVPELMEEIEKRILEAKIERANSMRVKRSAKRVSRGLLPLQARDQPPASSTRASRAPRAQKADKPARTRRTRVSKASPAVAAAE
jgi:hypothetical protein